MTRTITVERHQQHYPTKPPFYKVARARNVLQPAVGEKVDTATLNRLIGEGVNVVVIPPPRGSR